MKQKYLNEIKLISVVVYGSHYFISYTSQLYKLKKI